MLIFQFPYITTFQTMAILEVKDWLFPSKIILLKKKKTKRFKNSFMRTQKEGETKPESPVLGSNKRTETQKRWENPRNKENMGSGNSAEKERIQQFLCQKNVVWKLYWRSCWNMRVGWSKLSTLCGGLRWTRRQR